MKIAFVAVPFFVIDQHLEFAKQAMQTVKSKYELIKIAVVNRVRNENDLSWLRSTFDIVQENDRNNLARAWNTGINLAFEHGAQYVLISNLDLIYQLGAIDRLVRFAHLQPQALIWSAHDTKQLETLESMIPESEFSEGVGYASFLVDRKLFEKVGMFDEGYEGAYFEDSDMDYRLRLGKYSRLTTKLSYYYHFDRGTVKSLAVANDEQLVREIDKMRERNRQRYIEKWGGDIWQEKFTEPFDGT